MENDDKITEKSQTGWKQIIRYWLSNGSLKDQEKEIYIFGLIKR